MCSLSALELTQNVQPSLFGLRSSNGRTRPRISLRELGHRSAGHIIKDHVLQYYCTSRHINERLRTGGYVRWPPSPHCRQPNPITPALVCKSPITRHIVEVETEILRFLLQSLIIKSDKAGWIMILPHSTRLGGVLVSFLSHEHTLPAARGATRQDAATSVGIRAWQCRSRPVCRLPVRLPQFPMC